VSPLREPGAALSRAPTRALDLLGAVDASAFAFVMATGIVSIAAALQRLPVLSDALLVVASGAWLALGLLVSLRALHVEHLKPRLGSFALVAATAVLGARFALAGAGVSALALWGLATAAWLALLARRPCAGNPDGGWFLLVVGTQSLAVLASLLAARWSARLLAAALGWWTLGLGLYPIIALALVFALRRHRRFGPESWITMGALAITTLAGSELLISARALHAFGSLYPWLRVADLATWALASAWIPPLIAAELRNRHDWRYRSGRWSFVFPLGMYAVATQTLGRAAELTLLAGIGRAFFVIGTLAWALVAVGLVRAGLDCRRFGRYRASRDHELMPNERRPFFSKRRSQLLR
jgi:tellurite resistance protein TehA-like permease